MGLDYLSNGHDDTDNDDGIKIIKPDIFKRRTELETLRFFKETNPNINMSIADGQITSNDEISNTSFSFLSPSRVDLPRKSISLLEQNDIPITAKTKKNRVLQNISDGKISKKNKFSQIHTAILLQKLTTKPVASLYDRYGSSKPVDNLSELGSKSKSR